MTNVTNLTSPKATRGGHLEWVPLDQIHINAAAQREFSEPWALHILKSFDIDKLQYPTVNLRDGVYYVVDGQHSLWAYKMWLGSWEDQKIQCMVHKGLTEAQEAELFLSLNNKKSVSVFDKFRVGVNAGRPEECDIDRIVRANQCVITRNRSQSGAISAVGALRTIYRDHGAEVLGATVRIIRDAYGDAGYEAPILRGVAAVLNRFPALDRVRLQLALHDAHAGSKGLLNSAAAIRKNVGGTQVDAVAQAIVKIYNRSKGSKLPTWEVAA